MKAAVIGKGKMGSMIAQTLQNKGHEVVVMTDALSGDTPDVLNGAEMILDFSHRDNLDWYLPYAVEAGIPLVLGTTALEESQLNAVQEASHSIPLFFAANYSLGIAVLSKLVKDAAEILGDWDIEIVEKHHNQKADAPSGTALALLHAADPAGAHPVIYGRGPQSPKRGKEIAVHALRGGTLAGYHDVEFLGEDETLSLVHNAQSRQIFVNGAIAAAEFLQNQPAGLYNMDAMLEERLG